MSVYFCAVIVCITLQHIHAEEHHQFVDESKEVNNQSTLLDGEDECRLYGEMGTPTFFLDLTPEETKLMQEQYYPHNFNAYISDRISVYRSLTDPRDEICKKPGRYASWLPPTSVIICFHNEAWSVLLRTIHSVLKRTKPELLQEILLIDDLSDMEHLKRQLDAHVESLEKVKIFHSSKRLGIGNCRALGAEMAKANIVTFLDSHCEVTEGWIEPLLDTIHKRPKAAVVPAIEVIDHENFEVYHMFNCESIQVGGLNLGLNFMWRPVPSRDKLNRHPCDNVKSPTMAGGLFAISKDFFKHLGYYDENMEIWGAEHIEFSLKIWMCGGSIELAPCSHVAHVFRKSPFSDFEAYQPGNYISKNLARIAEVWLDDYKLYFYAHGGGYMYDDLDVRKALHLKNKLKCKSFDWYLTHVYPEMFIPDTAPASGELTNVALLDYCLDSFNGYHHTQPGISLCDHQGGGQLWFLSPTGEIRTYLICLQYSLEYGLWMMVCDNNKNLQHWTYNPRTQQIFHPHTERCLSVDHITKKLELLDCVDDDIMKWKFEYQDIYKILEIQNTV